MRDHREIIVAGEARSVRPAGPASRRASPRLAAEPTEWRSLLGACLGGSLRTCRDNPGTVLGSLAALGAVVVVSVNALGYQAGRHPAPIMPQIASPQIASPKLASPKVALRQDAAPPKAAAAKPVDAVAEGGSDAPRPAAKAVEAAKPAARDPIGDMIRSEDTTASVTPKPDRPVMQAQRALSKLGYGPLKPDGVMGSGTRTAIEKFERDRKLPVKGEATGRTLRELVARAGLPPG